MNNFSKQNLLFWFKISSVFFLFLLCLLLFQLKYKTYFLEYLSFSEIILNENFEKLYQKSVNYVKDHNEFIKSSELKCWSEIVESYLTVSKKIFKLMKQGQVF